MTLTRTETPTRVLSARVAAGEQYLAYNPTDIEAHREVADLRDELARRKAEQ